MINKADFYYFSPTGGTKKTGEIFAREIAENVEFIDLGSKQEQKETDHELAVIAIPVFGGRLPAFASERQLHLQCTEHALMKMLFWN